VTGAGKQQRPYPRFFCPRFMGVRRGPIGWPGTARDEQNVEAGGSARPDRTVWRAPRGSTEKKTRAGGVSARPAPWGRRIPGCLPTGDGGAGAGCGHGPWERYENPLRVGGVRPMKPSKVREGVEGGFERVFPHRAWKGPDRGGNFGPAHE